MAGEDDKKYIGEVVQFKIVEKERIVEVPKFVEKIVEVPKYIEKIYEKPVVKDVVYEKPVVVEKDITGDLQALIRKEVEKSIAEVFKTLKFNFEIPMPKIMNVSPGKPRSGE